MSSYHRPSAPRGYVPGLGRGAAGFTTRSDIGPAAATPSSSSQDTNVVGNTSSGTGSRAAELREAKLRMRAAQAKVGGPTGLESQFGQAPKGYVAGAGRGAGLNSSAGENQSGPSGYDDGGLFDNTPYDNEDEEADQIYESIDDKMSRKHKKRKANDHSQKNSSTKIGEQFREFKEQLKNVTEDQWDAIPEVGDTSLKYKQKRRQDVFTPLPDSVLVSKSVQNRDATASAAISATSTTMDYPNNANNSSGFQSVVTNMSGLAEARGTMLGMSLDKMTDSTTSNKPTTLDPNGYLTSLSTLPIATSAEISDVHKARLLLKSVRDTNPKHAPGWIAAARVEEAANKIVQARKVIQMGCETCPESEDVWLEAARLFPPQTAKTILATAVRRIPHSVKLFLRAADLESSEKNKKTVLRKALEQIPTSIQLWKKAIDLEEEEDAKILLSVAVEKVPHSLEMWLALAKLEDYEQARKVLNQARKHLPHEKKIWITAAQLEESQNHEKNILPIIQKAISSFQKQSITLSREDWRKEAELSELNAKAPLTSAAIITCTIGQNVDSEDRLRTWSQDATFTLNNGAIATARAILAHALTHYSSKKSLWLQAVELEKNHGSLESLDEVLAAASERLPKTEIFWLVRAKEHWKQNNVDRARQILTEAFQANPESEPVWLAGAKLEWETGEVERSRVLLQRARERASSERVFMKSALLERMCGNWEDALDLIEEGIRNYPSFAKLYMMGGQIWSIDRISTKALDSKALEKARKFYKRGLDACPQSIALWTLASQLEEIVESKGTTKARSILELARLKNPKNDQLWLESIRLERRANNDKLAWALMARALQECPSSGLLLAENIKTSPRVEQKSKSAHAIQKCPDDALVISSVASLFASEKKDAKARKWFERAIILNPDIGDSWALYYSFELQRGTVEQQSKLKERCIIAEPKHGEVWCRILKDMKHNRVGTGDGLELVDRKSVV